MSRKLLIFFMKRLILMIILLMISIIFSMYYLLESRNQKTAFTYCFLETPMIYQKKEIMIEDIRQFVFEEYFCILSENTCDTDYEFEEDRILIRINGKEFRYPYQIREPEVITVEKIIYKEKIKTERIVSEEENDDRFVYYEEESDYFRFRESSISFEKGTDISEIIGKLKECADTNQDISIDYSSLNPNQNGIYTVYFITEDKKYQFSVEIR